MTETIEIWTYAGMRAEGKSVEWADATGSICSFKAKKGTKGDAVASQYEVTVVTEDGEFVGVEVPMNAKYVGQLGEDGLAELNDSMNLRQNDMKLEAEEKAEKLYFLRGDLSIEEWVLKDIAARGSKQLKSSMRKLDIENERLLRKLTLEELNSKMAFMAPHEKAIILGKIIRYLHW